MKGPRRPRSRQVGAQPSTAAHPGWRLAAVPCPDIEKEQRVTQTGDTDPQAASGTEGAEAEPAQVAPDDGVHAHPESLSADLLRTGAEHPVDPEDLAMAMGHDPTPAAVERARRLLAEKGAAAVESVVP